MVRPIVDSDIVAARCTTGTIQQARPMKTSVVLRPIRMMASDGDGRLRKRAIAPTNTSANRVMAPTSAAAICQISIPWNSDMTLAPFLVLDLGAGRSPVELLFPVVAHEHHLGSTRERLFAFAHAAVQQKLGAAVVVDPNLPEPTVKHGRGDHADLAGQFVLGRRAAPTHVDEPRREARKEAHPGEPHQQRRPADAEEPDAVISAAGTNEQHAVEEDPRE